MPGTHSNYCLRNIAISVESAKYIRSTVFSVLLEIPELFSMIITLLF